MVSRQKEQLVGVFIIIVSLVMLYLNWTNALNKGYFYVMSSGLSPFFVVMGIAFLFIPSYKRERLEKGEDISKLKGLQLLTKRWRVVLAIGLAAGLINLYLLGYNF